MSLRALFLGVALALLSATPASAQPADAPGVPTGQAAIRGRVVHAEGGPAAGVEVLLYALPANAPPGVRRGTSGPDGRFAFEGIDHDPATTYLVGARWHDVSYPGARVQFGSGEREREVEVRVHEVTEEVGSAVFRELRMRLDWTGARLEVSEDVTVENADPRTVFVSEARRAGRKPAVELGLPTGARNVSGPLNLLPEGVVVEGARLRWFGPVYPGGAELGYHYELPSPAGPVTIERSLPDEPIRVSVLAPAGGLKVEAPGLVEAAEPTVVLGRGYRVLTGELSGRLALSLDVPVARHDAGAVSVGEVRILGELDAAAFDGREEHILEVAGDAPVVAEDGKPLVAIPIPTAATDVRFGSADSAAQVVPLPDGTGIGVLGPLAPGKTSLEIRYRLPADGGPFTLTRRFGAHVPLLSVYLADTGDLRIDSDRLHRRRPAKTPDRTYVHLEAFELAPGEEASFTVALRPLQRQVPRGAMIGLVALLTGLAAFALVGPLRRAPAAADAAPAEPPPESDAERESEATLAALEDLEHDYETGKLDAADHDQLRADLTAALERSRAEMDRGRSGAPVGAPSAAGSAPETARASAATPAAADDGDLPALAETRSCKACATAVGRNDRFCARCGAPLA
jgi:hypothetical protein